MPAPPWYCHRIHGAVEHYIHADGTSCYALREDPCDCFFPEPHAMGPRHQAGKIRPRGSFEFTPTGTNRRQVALPTDWPGGSIPPTAPSPTYSGAMTAGNASPILGESCPPSSIAVGAPPSRWHCVVASQDAPNAAVTVALPSIPVLLPVASFSTLPAAPPTATATAQPFLPVCSTVSPATAPTLAVPPPVDGLGSWIDLAAPPPLPLLPQAPQYEEVVPVLPPPPPSAIGMASLIPAPSIPIPTAPSAGEPPPAGEQKVGGWPLPAPSVAPTAVAPVAPVSPRSTTSPIRTAWDAYLPQDLAAADRVLDHLLQREASSGGVLSHPCGLPRGNLCCPTNWGAGVHQPPRLSTPESERGTVGVPLAASPGWWSGNASVAIIHNHYYH